MYRFNLKIKIFGNTCIVPLLQTGIPGLPLFTRNPNITGQTCTWNIYLVRVKNELFIVKMKQPPPRCTYSFAKCLYVYYCVCSGVRSNNWNTLLSTSFQPLKLFVFDLQLVIYRRSKQALSWNQQKISSPKLRENLNKLTATDRDWLKLCSTYFPFGASWPRSNHPSCNAVIEG